MNENNYDREVLIAVISNHRPSSWRSFSNDEVLLRCCGTDFGRMTGKPKKTDIPAQEQYEAHLRNAILAAGFARRTQDVTTEYGLLLDDEGSMEFFATYAEAQAAAPDYTVSQRQVTEWLPVVPETTETPA